MSEYIITDEQIAENRRLHGKMLLVMPVIVRCRDCAYICNREYANGLELHTCNYFDSEHAEVELDGFCKWGERKLPEIIHCLDCLYVKTCDVHHQMVMETGESADDGFCAWGERKEND